jgi:hypothetical protein
MKLQIPNDIARTYDLLKGSGPLEAFFNKGDTHRTRFYTDKEPFIKETAFMNSEEFTCYAGIQPRIDCLNSSASNEGIKVLHKLYTDIDPIRPDKTNATDEEKAKALKVAVKVQTDFISQGYEKPVIGDSGNGYWVFFSIPEILIDDSNRAEIQAKLKAWGQGIVDKYSSDAVEIDHRVYDLKRITKVFGTRIFNKPETEGRPQRVSGFVDDHEPIQDQKLKDDFLSIPVDVEPETAKSTPEGKDPFNIDRMFEHCYLLRFLKGKADAGTNLTHSVRLGLSTLSLGLNDLENGMPFITMMLKGCLDFSEQKTRYYLERNSGKGVPYGCEALKTIIKDHFKDFEPGKCNCNLPLSYKPDGNPRKPSPIRYAYLMAEDLDSVWEQLERSENSFQDYLSIQNFSSEYLSQVPKDQAKAFLDSKKEDAGLKAGTVKDLLKNAEVEAKEKKPTQAEILIKLSDAAEFFKDLDGIPFTTFPVESHRETWPLRSSKFKEWLGHRFYKQEKKPAGGQAFADALSLIAARATFQGEKKEVFTRIASLDDRVFIDMGNDAWEVVEVTAAGYRVLPESPIKFRRSNGMVELPHPVKGSLRDIKRFLNVKAETDWSLIGAWMVAAFSKGPYPVIILLGEQGTGKSVISRMLKSVVDPSTSPLRSTPRNPQDLMIAGKNGWVLCFDNLSGMPTWLSDSICRLATGGGFGTRTLYSNDGETIFNNMRPVILNGISDVASRHDLIDRTVMINLDMIPEDMRKPEKEIWKDFDRIKPRILGGLFDAVGAAIRNQDKVSFERLPRMADFAIWSAAAEKETPWTEGITFMDAYSGNRSAAIEMAVDADLVSSSIMSLLLLEEGYWKGSSTELLERLTELIPENSRKVKSWPKQAHFMTGRIKRASTFLRTLGIEVVFPDRSKKIREYTISMKNGSAEQSKGSAESISAAPKNIKEKHHVKPLGSAGSAGSAEIHTNSKKGFSQKNDGGVKGSDNMVVVNI